MAPPWSHLVQNPVTSCTIPCQSLYQTLSRLVPDFFTPCTQPCHLVPKPVPPFTKPCHTLYQTLSYLVTALVTPYNRLCHTLYPTLSYLVPNPVTSCTRLCHTLYQTLPTPCTASVGPGEARPHASCILKQENIKKNVHFRYCNYQFSGWYVSVKLGPNIKKSGRIYFLSNADRNRQVTAIYRHLRPLPSSFLPQFEVERRFVNAPSGHLLVKDGQNVVSN